MKFLITEPDYFYEDIQNLFKEYGEVKIIDASMEKLLSSIKDIDVLLVSLELNINRKVIEMAKKI